MTEPNRDSKGRFAPNPKKKMYSSEDLKSLEKKQAIACLILVFISFFGGMLCIHPLAFSDGKSIGVKEAQPALIKQGYNWGVQYQKNYDMAMANYTICPWAIGISHDPPYCSKTDSRIQHFDENFTPTWYYDSGDYICFIGCYQ